MFSLLAAVVLHVHWYSCQLHVQNHRITSRQCVSYAMPHAPRRPLAWTLTRTWVNPHTMHSIRYPVFALPSCYPARIRRWSADIYHAHDRTGVPVSLLAATVGVESEGNPRAVSSDGYASIGLMQLVPSTAAWIMRVPVTEARNRLYTPRWNILAGATYLAYLHRVYGGPWLAAAGHYNGGGWENPFYEAKVAGRMCG